MTSSQDFGEFPYRPSPLVQKLSGVRDLKRILETTVRELGDTFNAEACQVMLSNPLDPNVTSICEYKASPDGGEGDTTVTVPLVLQGRTFGSVSVSRDTQLTPDELNALRVLLGELGDIIRLAQINDIVQRDTFRETFLVEIGNVMAYSMGIGDALFLVVNILGKALNASRCLFICTDDQQAGWKCYEFWQQDKVASCQEYYWPATDSPLVAQVLLSRTPLKVFEGRDNSYVSPVQEELQFINVKSLLGVALRSEKGTHGCVILQQCDYRRAWTRSETDMVQNVADKVAEALLKLPAEKLAREPIMQLHQRIVPAGGEQEPHMSDVQLRNALKGALGQQAIPSARKTSQMQAPAPKPAPAPPPPPPPPAPPAPPPQETAPPAPVPAPMPPPAPATVAPAQEAAPPPPPPPAPAPAATETSSGVWSSPAVAIDFTQSAQVPTPQTPSGSLDVTATLPVAPLESLAPLEDSGPSPTIKPITRSGRTESAINIPKPAEDPGASQPRLSVEIDAKAAPPPTEDPYADLDFGDEPVLPEPQPAKAPAEPAQPPVSPSPVEPAVESGWGNLDAIPTPKSAGTVGGGAPAREGWGNLDEIPTPASVQSGLGIGGGGLKGSMLGKAKATSAASPLMSSFRKARGAEDAPAQPTGQAPAAPIDEEAAKKKIDQIMSNAANETSDYIFATKGLDARLLGRIDGWVAQIEQKDRYKNGHARQVAQYAVAIGEELGIAGADLDTIRQAALVHDLGKLGIAQQILQKADEDLEDEQFVLKMGHAVAGAQLLESFPDLKHLAPIVIAHHEEYDGEGFPQGLKGDEIPVPARILSVANAYHELVALKVYGPGMDPESAQQQMVEGAGSQFDPTLVEALIQVIKSGKMPPSF